MPQKWTWIPRELPAVVLRSFTSLNPWRTGRPAGKCVLQRDGADEDARHAAEHQLQSAIVKAMYAATIESELERSQRWILFLARTVRSSGTGYRLDW